MRFAFLTSLLIYAMSYSAQGTDYFQQKVDTEIAVTLDDKNHILTGYEKILYTNNANVALDKIILHIWPNAYRNNSSALATQLDENGEIDFHFADSVDRGFIDQLDFKVNGQPIKYEYYEDQIDIIEIKLTTPLKSGEQLTIETPFRVKVPKGIYSRLGHIGESYQITQWFPKPAVYDQNGWHPLTYLSQGEFYSEYGDYDVKITLPSNYVVGATGDLVNGEDELAFLEEKIKKTKERINGNGPSRNKAGYYINSFPASDTTMKTLHFHQENVHDFAWFADKRFNVLKGEVELPHSGRKVTTWAMFTNNEFDLWKNSIEYLNDATYYYSKWTGDYPYNHVTAVDGSISAGGGMEYPNVTVIGESYTPMALEQVIVHEVGHNWFYGILGSNERINAWMDEGLNTFMENRYTEHKYPGTGMDFGLPAGLMKKVGLDQFGPRGMYDIGYVYNARRNYDQAIQTPSNEFTPMNYGAIVYGKTGIGFDYLMAYLGEELFDKCMHTYFDQWKFKHPQPKDIRVVFEEVSGKNLEWLFDDYIKTTKKMDYGITKVKTKGDSIYLTLKNKAQINAPFSLTGMNQGVKGATYWFEGFDKKQTVSIPNTDQNEVQLDFSNDMPTINRKDDHIRTSGLLKKTEPLKFKFLGSYEKSDETHIYYTPTFGWNAQDKSMLGMAFYNTAVPERKLEWLVMPMYSFGGKTLTGVGDIKYNLNLQDQLFRKVSFGYNFKSFSVENEYSGPIIPLVYLPAPTINQWMRNEVVVDMELNTKLRKPKHNIMVRGLRIYEPIAIGRNDITDAFNLTYEIKNKQVLKPASIKFDVTSLSSRTFGTFTGISFEGKIRKNYNLNLRGIELRVFAGQTLARNEREITTKYNWSLTGQRGANDYLYDYTLLGRSQATPNMTAQQNTESHGNFKTNTLYNIGSNDQWVAALNVKAEVPFKFPLGVFADAGLHPSRTYTNGTWSNEVNFQYDAGLYIPIRKDIFEIYIPLLYSQDIKDQITYQEIRFLQRIRFTFSFDELNPFKMVRNIKP